MSASAFFQPTLRALISRDAAIVLALGTLGIVAVALSLAPVGVDDAYISYRYADNLAQGHGAVYNPGDRSYGSNTLAWVGLLALGSRLGGTSAETTAHAVAFVFVFINEALLYLLMRRVGTTRVAATVAGLLLLAAPLYLQSAVMGMETPFYGCAILAAFLAAASQCWLLAGLLAGAAFAIRPDGLAVVAALLAAAWLVSVFGGAGLSFLRRLLRGFSRPVWLILAGFVLVAVPFALLCYFYYGSVLPHTLWAKRLHPLYAGRWWMLRFFIGAMGSPVLFVLAALGYITLVRRRPLNAATAALSYVTFAAVVWMLLYVGAWSAVRIDFYPWYLAALAPVFVILAGLTFSWARARWTSRIPRGVVLSVLIVLVAYWTHHARSELRRFHVYVKQFELPRKHCSEFLHTCAAPGSSIGAGAIGLIGYYAPTLKLFDYAGLVSPLADVVDRATVIPDLVYGAVDPGMADRYVRAAIYCPSVVAPDSDRWIRRDRLSTWHPERWPVTRRLDADFGSTVHLLGVSPICDAVAPGDRLQLLVLWRFDQPLPGDCTISYELTADSGAAVARLDTHGFFRDQRPFADLAPGESVLDFVNIPVLPETPPGTYKLSLALSSADGRDSQRRTVLTAEVQSAGRRR